MWSPRVDVLISLCVSTCVYMLLQPVRMPAKLAWWNLLCVDAGSCFLGGAGGVVIGAICGSACRADVTVLVFY